MRAAFRSAAGNSRRLLTRAPRSTSRRSHRDDDDAFITKAGFGFVSKTSNGSGVLEQPSPPPRVSAPSSSAAAAACASTSTRGRATFAGSLACDWDAANNNGRRRSVESVRLKAKENRFGDGDFGGKTKRLYSKSLGTDGGLKPDQVAVPESYVVLDPSKFSVKQGEEEEKVKISDKNVFAVVSIGSHQYKVSPDDLFFVEKLHGANVNDIVHLPRVLMLGSKTKTIIGRPVVENAYVKCLVEEVVRGEKMIIFKKRRRKNSRRWNGVRQTMTSLRVLDVEGIEE
mgnify:CR=1 FL=1